MKIKIIQNKIITSALFAFTLLGFNALTYATAPATATKPGCTGSLVNCGTEAQPACINAANDPQNCGKCGISCNGGACNNGVCCGAAQPNVCSGICTNVSDATDSNNCGSCGHVCSGGSPTCILTPSNGPQCT